MPWSRYYFDDGQSRRFWSINRRGKKITTRSGRLGSAGREVVREFATPAEAKATAEKQAASKLKKGYTRVEASLLNFQKQKGATEAQVKAFERLVGLKLPKQYRDFLLIQNGGSHDRGSFSVDDHPTPYGYIAYAPSFYTLKQKANPWESLEAAWQQSSRLLPEGHIPITDSGGNLITIDAKTKVGCVYYFDHELPHQDIQALAELEDEYVYTQKDAILVAGTFHEFLTRIATYVDVEV